MPMRSCPTVFDETIVTSLEPRTGEAALAVADRRCRPTTTPSAFYDADGPGSGLTAAPVMPSFRRRRC